MGSILNLLQRLEKIDTDKICVDSLEQVKDQIEEKNRERMMEGIRSDGSVMPNYSPISQTVYGYPDEPIKLKATGAFQAGIKVEVTNSGVTTTSTDSKNEKLEKRYGPEIHGLGKTEFKSEVVNESLRPVFKKNMENATGLKFK